MNDAGPPKQPKSRPVLKIEVQLGQHHSFRWTYYRKEGRFRTSHQVDGFGSLAQKASMFAEQGAAMLRGLRTRIGHRLRFWR